MVVTNLFSTNLVSTNLASRAFTANALGYTIRYVDPVHFATNRLEAARVAEVKGLPESLYWYGHLSVEPVTNEWNLVYTVDSKPVMIARRIGLGALIVMADSFLFSNEGLHIARAPDFLLWTIGPGRHAIFDETHLGVQRGTGVTVLMREYRLHGLFVGCLLLVGLQEWARSFPSSDPEHAKRLAQAQELAKAFGASKKPRNLAAAQHAISNILFPKRT